MFSNEQPTTRWRRLALIGSVLVAVAVGFFLIPLMKVAYTVTEPYETTETYYETETYTTTQDESLRLFTDRTFSLVSGNKIFSVDIDISDKSSNVVSGYFILRDIMVDYTFYVVDQADYYDHSIYTLYPPNNPYVAIVPASHITNNAFSFVPGHSDTYYLVFTTTELYTESESGGFIDLEVRWDWQETVIVTEEVPKERTVSAENIVTYYKNVSLWDYLMNYQEG